MSLQDTYDSMYSSFSIPQISGSYDSVYATPTTPSVAPVAQSTSNQSGWQKTLDTLTALFDGGVAAYNDIAKKTGLPTSNGTPTSPVQVAAAQAQAPSAIPGLNQTQFLLVAGGVGLIVLFAIIKRR